MDRRTAESSRVLQEAAARQSGDRSLGHGFGDLSFRSRLTWALILAALGPLAAFGLLVVLIGAVFRGTGASSPTVLIFVLLVLALLAVPFAVLLAGQLLKPLRRVAGSVDRMSAGDLSGPLIVSGDDELARLAESHNRLAADLQRRSNEVGQILEAIAAMSPRDDMQLLSARAGDAAKGIFELIEATVYLGRSTAVPESEPIPGETRALRAVLRVGGDELGVLVGWLPATRAWARADQDLFELFASQVAVALRTAQLFAQVEAQNTQLVALGEAKDEFLRGVSHNLQTPLTSIRAYAEQLAHDAPDRRLEIIAEQSERLSRMVRQLLTVSRLQSGAIQPRSEVVNVAHRARRAWEALGATDVPFTLDDLSRGWLAIGDPDQLDQVLWALFDNAVKYGRRTAVSVRISPDPTRSRLQLTLRDDGPGISAEDRARLFTRFARGRDGSDGGGSGLGLYVSRELCRAMGGDLFLPATAPARGATLLVELPAERAHEG